MSVPSLSPESMSPATPGSSASPLPGSSRTPQEARGERFDGLAGLAEVRWAALATALFLLALALQVAGSAAAVSTPVFLAAYVAGGLEPGLAGLRALRGRTLDVDLLMVVAAIGAALIGQVLDGGLLIVIFSTSGALEAVATKRTQDSVRALLTLAPERATVLRPDGTEVVVESADLQVGDLVVVRPGERIGADGRVDSGASEVDQATITGEPMPVFRGVGDEVFAGSLNGEGALQVRVLRSARDSVVARIVALVEQASATKARTQLFIERVEQRYSVSMVAATVAVFAVPLALGGDLQPTLLRAMTFMIVASPCAVVLATMPPLLSAIANAGRHGVLVKSAVIMEQFGDITHVALDKTGTLTMGSPHVAEIRLLPGSTAPADADRLLSLAAAAERPSEHPIGRAVVALAVQRGLEVVDVAGFQSAPGRGVVALAGGVRVEVGSPRLLRDGGPAAGSARAVVEDLEGAGRTAVVVVLDGTPAGVLGLADQLRPGAAEAVASLTTITGRAPVLITGDNARAAWRLAAEVGITDIRAELLPQDKVAEVDRLHTGGHRVLVVGDGVNDAPALAAADVGVAMGRQGSDLALTTADAIVVRDELDTVPAAIALSRRAHRAVVQNLVLAGVAIVGLVAWDLLGHLSLAVGVAGHEGGTVLIGLNGLRLLRDSAWRPARDVPPAGRGSRPRPAGDELRRQADRPRGEELAGHG